MRSNKLKLCVLGVISLMTIGVASILSNETLLAKTFANNITKDGNDRVLTIDSPLNIDGTVGTAAIGTIGVYAPNCRSIENGVARLNNGQMVIYCPEAGINDQGYYHGFSGSTVSAISLLINNNNIKRTIRVYWAGMDINNNVTLSSNANNRGGTETPASNNDQTVSFTTSNAFLGTYQNANKSAGFSCFYIYEANTNAFDLISVTITYSCN